MTMTPRDRRALAYLGVSALLSLVYYMWPDSSAPKVVAASGDPIAATEKRLAKLRETVATVPAKEAVVKNLSAVLAEREKGLIQADTAAQAQAQLIQTLRRLAASEAPPIELKTTELNGITPFGDAYGVVNVAVSIDCRIDQLVNLLAAIASQPELISTNELRITSSNVRDKIIGARLAISGIVPRKLVPEKLLPEKLLKGAQ